jgi:hypothetical protein
VIAVTFFEALATPPTLCNLSTQMRPLVSTTLL